MVGLSELCAAWRAAATSAGVVAIDAAHIPVGGGESGELIGRIRHAHFAVNGDAIVVPQHDEVVELQVARQGDGFLGNAFHQAAVAGQHIGLVIDEVIAEAGGQVALGNGKAHGIGKALAQGPGGGFNAGGMAIFRVARGLGAQLPEVLELLQRHVLVARQKQQRIQQHGAVAGGENEAVAIRPMRIAGIKIEELGEQHRGKIRRTHGQAGMAGIGFLDGIHAEGANRIGHGFMHVGGGNSHSRGNP